MKSPTDNAAATYSVKSVIDRGICLQSCCCCACCFLLLFVVHVVITVVVVVVVFVFIAVFVAVVVAVGVDVFFIIFSFGWTNRSMIRQTGSLLNARLSKLAKLV